MTNRNSEIKDYICNFFVKEDRSFLAAKARAIQENLPKIAIPENVGKLLYLLTRIQKPKRILEIGTLSGYSTLWLAKGAPDAEIVTLENNPKHAKVARENFCQAGVGDKIKLIEGDALETLKWFVKNAEAPFDLIFLDADKEGYPHYLPLLIELSRQNTLLLTDNLIPKEEPINDPFPGNKIAVGIYRYNDLVTSHPNLDSIIATTLVGEQGRLDGLGISLIDKNERGESI